MGRCRSRSGQDDLELTRETRLSLCPSVPLGMDPTPDRPSSRGLTPSCSAGSVPVFAIWRSKTNPLVDSCLTPGPGPGSCTLSLPDLGGRSHLAQPLPEAGGRFAGRFAGPPDRARDASRGVRGVHPPSGFCAAPIPNFQSARTRGRRPAPEIPLSLWTMSRVESPRIDRATALSDRDWDAAQAQGRLGKVMCFHPLNCFRASIERSAQRSFWLYLLVQRVSASFLSVPGFSAHSAGKTHSNAGLSVPLIRSTIPPISESTSWPGRGEARPITSQRPMDFRGCRSRIQAPREASWVSTTEVIFPAADVRFVVVSPDVGNHPYQPEMMLWLAVGGGVVGLAFVIQLPVRSADWARFWRASRPI